jgi:UDP-N-acetylmuramoylalanine--D-glutamate ligase
MTGAGARARPPLPPGPYAVLGLARSGTAAARALRARGERVIGLDAGAPDGAQELAELGVELHTGERAAELPERARALIKSPGVPQRAPALVSARARGLPVLGELELGWRLLENEFIAVTGTNGKTTTAELIGHVHRQAGLPVVVAGNVGAAVSGFAGTVEARATIVCEASSFQLEDTLAFAPEAAVLINLSPDHLDRHESFDAYAQAKANAFARQREEDVAVLPSVLLSRQDEPARSLREAGRARRVCFGSDAAAELRERHGELCWRARHLLDAHELRLRGRHNLENAVAAAAVCLARGVDAEAVRAGLRSFAGVPHRLEVLACRNEVMFVNDSKATNVASTLVALEAFSDRAGIHLILGGQGKGQDFAPLCAPVRRRCRAAYLIGEDADSIGRALAPSGVALHACGTLERATAAAAGAARAGEVVLLSPACASFDQFRDFEARGERFRELVSG